MSKVNVKTTGKPIIWTMELTKKLIILYENYPCLYNIKSSQYHNKIKRIQALEDIKNNLMDENKFITVDAIKKKIHGIRSQYLTEINKIKKSEASGASTDDIYVPKLWFFDMAYFLNDSTNVTCKGESNLDLGHLLNPVEGDTQEGDFSALQEDKSSFRDDIEYSDYDNIEIVYDDPGEGPSHSSYDICDKENRFEDTPSTIHRQNKVVVQTPKKRKVEHLDNILVETTKALKNLHEPKPLAEENDLLLFGRYLASEMAKLDEDTADDLKAVILKELFKAKRICKNKKE
ncbi:uncharacterized protein [Diabrotica undecimpunctata]|uniref:uncharacterized protein n=1 Tax=Diabrotica undecimpunctata TaxID=50387 RepID=UPI003B63602F